MVHHALACAENEESGIANQHVKHTLTGVLKTKIWVIRLSLSTYFRKLPFQKFRNYNY